MMIDWVSLKLSTEHLDFDDVRAWQETQSRLLRVAPGKTSLVENDAGERLMLIDINGGILWDTCAWDSVRSDSHQLAFQVTGTHIRIQGSPARILGDGDNVFSCGAAAALDLYGCADRMIKFITTNTGISFPVSVKLWDVTRVDVTENLYLGTLPNVRQALTILRNCEGGRYRVSQQAGDTVYWSHKSRLRSGKAYAKGAELIHKMEKLSKSKIEQPACQYDLEKLSLASGLLRLELKLGAQYWRERIACKWHDIKSDDLASEWRSYFSRMIGGAEIMSEQDIYKRLLNVVDIDKNGNPKEGQAKAAFSLWCLIKSEGWQVSRDITSKPTWYRNLKHLKNAGLSDADISAGNVVQLRSKILEARPVTSWRELREVHYSQAA